MYKSKLGEGAVKVWNLVWRNEYRRFLKLAPGEAFCVDTQVVIGFLIELKRRGKKAWQRLQALRTIMMFGRDLRFAADHGEEFASKLKALVDREKAEAESAPDIKELSGRIGKEKRRGEYLDAGGIFGWLDHVDGFSCFRGRPTGRRVCQMPCLSAIFLVHCSSP